MSEAVKKQEPGWTGVLIDFAPLLVFFLGYRFVGLIAGTALFMVAIVIALIVSKLKLGKVTPMLWLSAVLVVGFGGLTIWFNDERFIQVKPTIIYLLFAGLLLGGLALGKPLLKFLLQAAFDGMSERGWLLLSRNWAIFFLGMAALNEVVRRGFPFDTWLLIKVWGVTLLSLAFGAANLPMMLKHGLRVSDDEVAEAKPPEG